MFISTAYFININLTGEGKYVSLRIFYLSFCSIILQKGSLPYPPLHNVILLVGKMTCLYKQ